MPHVFTIYNCGTSHNRQNLDETVANLASRTEGAENRDWMINDGPGSFSKHVNGSASAYERGLAAKAHTPGSRNPATGMKEKFSLGIAKGIVTGEGWEHNVEHTMAVLNATVDLPRVINMAGWSRGAITCFMIAHALYENQRTRSIEVNIFAFEPVPGPGNFDDPNKITLPPNVRNYAAIVEQDERRKIFRPALVTPEEAQGVKAKFYYLPGIHSTPVFRTKNEVGLIAAFLAHKFLQKHGTRISGAIQLSPRDLCELYAKVRLDMGKYRSNHGGFLQALGVQARKTVNNMQDTEYFVNDHHVHQFRKTFPQIWSALQKGVSPGGESVFDRAAKTLQSFAPTTYLSLQKVGILT
jgi:hypothetical protein